MDTSEIMVKPVYELTDIPTMFKDSGIERYYICEPIRPVFDTLDQSYVKERETTWINEKNRYENLVNVIPEKETNEDDKLEKKPS